MAKYPTGLDDKLQDFKSTVLSQQGQESDVQARVVGIVGVGDIGKTTLVKQIFNRRCSEYDGSSFYLMLVKLQLENLWLICK